MMKLATSVIEQVAERPTDGMGTRSQLLTQSNRSAGRDQVKLTRIRVAKQDLTMPAACSEVLERQDRNYCDDCMEEVRTSETAFREAGQAKLEALRELGEDPAHSADANRQRGETMSQRQWGFGSGMPSMVVRQSPRCFAAGSYRGCRASHSD